LSLLTQLKELCRIEKDRWGSRETYVLTFTIEQTIVTIRIVLDDQSDAHMIITNMTTFPETKRCQGYGRGALSVLLRAARDNNLGDIRAVQVQEESEPFWKKMGFVSLYNHTNDFIYKGDG
jgi:predicted GNAT family N-acyltransferase